MIKKKETVEVFVQREALTGEKIRAASDKNKLWDEIIDVMNAWGSLPEEENSDAEDQLKELEEKYQSGLLTIEERVKEKIISLKEEGEHKLSELKEKKDQIAEKRKEILIPLLNAAAEKIKEKENEISSMGNSQEERNRIYKLRSEIAEVKRNCEQEAEKFEPVMKAIAKEEQQIQQEYLGQDLEENLRKNSLQEFEKIYREKKRNLQEEKHEFFVRRMQCLEEKLPLEEVKRLCNALKQCDINQEQVWNYLKYIQVGYRRFERTIFSDGGEMPEGLRDAFLQNYSCVCEENRIRVPFVVNYGCEEEFPVLIYRREESRGLHEKFKILCTAYCMTKIKEPVLLLHTGGVKIEEILPKTYLETDSISIWKIPEGKEASLMQALMEYFRKMQQFLAQEGATDLTEYNEGHPKQPAAHCIVVLDDLPQSFEKEEVRELVTLLKEGGKCGIRILACMEYTSLMKSGDISYLDLRKYLEEVGYGYDPDEKFLSSLKQGGPSLELFHLNEWKEERKTFLVHPKVSQAIRHFEIEKFLKSAAEDPKKPEDILPENENSENDKALKEDMPFNDTSLKDIPFKSDTPFKDTLLKDTRKNETEEKEKILKNTEEEPSLFLERFLRSKQFPDKVYFPGKITSEMDEIEKSESENENTERKKEVFAFPEDRGFCLKVWSRERGTYEELVRSLLMQQILCNLRENISQKQNRIYYFNFGENMISDAQADLSCEFGLSCCDKLQYITPETLLPGLKVCLQDMGEHMSDHTVWLCFSGLEYLYFYKGYEEEEKNAITDAFEELDQYLSTGNYGVFLAGCSQEMCSRIKGTQSIPVWNADLDRQTFTKDQTEKKLELWKASEKKDLRDFEQYILKY